MTPGRARLVAGLAAVGLTAGVALARHAWQTAGPPGSDFADAELALWLIVAAPLTGLFAGFAGWVVATEYSRVGSPHTAKPATGAGEPRA